MIRDITPFSLGDVSLLSMCPHNMLYVPRVTSGCHARLWVWSVMDATIRIMAWFSYGRDSGIPWFGTRSCRNCRV